MLGSFLDRRQTGTGSLSLPRALDVSLSVSARGFGVQGAILALTLDLLLQQLQVKVAEGIRAQAAALEALVGGDVRVVLQQLRDPAEDGGLYAMGSEGLEQ